MNITITLTSEQIKGIKAYLTDLDGEYTREEMKREINVYIRGIIDTTLNNPNESVSEYIRQASL